MRFIALLAAAMVLATASAEEIPSVLENEEAEEVVVRRTTYIRKDGLCYAKVLPARIYSKTTRSFSGYGAASCSTSPFRTALVGPPRLVGAGPTATKTVTRASMYRCTRAKQYRTRTQRSRVSSYNPFKPVKRC